jgi:hypothetical protein
MQGDLKSLYRFNIQIAILNEQKVKEPVDAPSRCAQKFRVFDFSGLDRPEKTR